jgi:hypothetical protein
VLVKLPEKATTSAIMTHNVSADDVPASPKQDDRECAEEHLHHPLIAQQHMQVNTISRHS